MREFEIFLILMVLLGESGIMVVEWHDLKPNDIGAELIPLK